MKKRKQDIPLWIERDKFEKIQWTNANASKPPPLIQEVFHFPIKNHNISSAENGNGDQNQPILLKISSFSPTVTTKIPENP